MTSILIVSNRPNSLWLSTLLAHLRGADQIVVVSEEKALSEVLRNPYVVVIIESAGVSHPSELIVQLSATDSDIVIFVASSDPNWQEARAVFRAGAADYFRQSLNKRDSTSIMNAILTVLDL